MENICLRCHEPILDGQETEEAPLIPRWGLTFTAHKGCSYPTPTLFEFTTMTHSDRRIRYEDLNYRIVTNNSNKRMWLESSKKDSLGETSWVGVSGVLVRDANHAQIGAAKLLHILWALLDSK